MLYNIFIYPFIYIIDFFIKIDDFNDNVDDFYEDIADIENDLAEIQNISILDNSVAESLKKTVKIFQSPEWLAYQKKTIFNKEEVKELCEEISYNIEKNTIDIVEYEIEKNLESYGEIIEACICSDITSFNINVIRMIDFLSKKTDWENPMMDKFVADFSNGEKSLDWICRLLKRSSASPLFNDEQKEQFIKRLFKPELVKR